MGDIRGWLESIGLEQYAEVFEENEIDWDVIPDLDHEVLRDIGISAAGARMRILKAIEALEPATETSDVDESEPEGTTGGQAERRQLTVMFCDLVGSTAMSEAMDPEDLRGVIGSYQSAATSAIRSYGGYVARYMGDGLLVYFGYPRAHEDDAERAVRAGLRVIDAMAGVGSIDGAALEVRVGIATGLVVVGDILGEGSSEERAALGETPNLAARLQAIAEPNSILIAASTQRLIDGRFNLESFPAQRLKGISAPVRVYRPTGIGEGSRFAVTHRGPLGQLVGRDEEIAVLWGRWEQATEGEGQVVLLGGEPGIGKSRLIEELRERVAPMGYEQLSLQCSPYYQNSPFQPVIRELETEAGFTREDDSASRLDKLEVLLATTGQRTERECGLIADLVSLPLERYSPLGLTAQRQKDETIAALERRFSRRAKNAPLLIVIEDAHWIDPSTAELISAVIEGLPSQPTLVIISHRPECELPWSAQGNVTQLSLNRLSKKFATALVTGVVGTGALSDEVLGQIVAKSQGVPLYAEELSKNILESEPRSLEGRAAGHDAHTLLAVPSTLQDSLMARLDRLGSIKEVAQLGAVLGREFSFGLIGAVSRLDQVGLTSALDRLVQSDLLSQRGRPPRATYAFKHALLQDAAYNSLLNATRTDLHARVARNLEEHFAPDVENEPELVAHHYSLGGLPDKAIAWSTQSAERAVGRSAYAEAIRHYENAIAEIDRVILTQSPQVSVETQRQALDLRLALRSAIIPAGKIERALECLREAEELARTLGDPGRMGRVAVYLSVHYYVVGQYAQTLVHAKHALALATSHEDVRLEAEANNYLGFAHSLRGDFEQGLNCFRRIHALTGKQVLDDAGPLIPPSVHAYAWAAQCYAELGCFEDGIACGIEGRKIGETLDRPLSLFAAYRGFGLLYLRKGDLEQALPLLETAVQICREVGSRTYFVTVASTLGAVYTLLGQTVDAVALLTQTLDQADALGIKSSQAIRFVFLGEAHLTAGNSEDATTCALEAQALSKVHHERPQQAYALHLLGDISRRNGAPEIGRARDYYRQALSLAGELGMRPLQAHCYRGLGALAIGAGNLAQANDDLRTAIEMYQDMGMNLWLPQTRRMLEPASGDRTATPSSF